MLTPMKRLLFAIVLLSAARTAAARGMFSETFAVTETAAVSAVSSASAETIASAVVSSSAEIAASAVSMLSAEAIMSAVSTASAETAASAVSSVSAEIAASAVSMLSAEAIMSAVSTASAETAASAVSSVSAEIAASAVSMLSAEAAASGLRAVFPETTVSAVPAAAGDFFRSGVPAAAASPASSAAVAALEPSADGRAAEILEKLAAGFRALGAYGVTFEVSSDEYTTRGRYAVEGENYYIAVGEAEVYCDGKIRYEIDNRRREVTIDDVDTSSRNLLSNPAHAFDFIGTQYAPSLVSDAEGRAVVRLTPTSADASPAGEILVTVDTAAMRPESLRYDYDGEQVGIAVLGVAPLDTPLKAFSKGDYKGYEFIDFR